MPDTAKKINLTEIKTIMNQQRFGVLSTNDSQSPHCSLVAFTVNENLTLIIFATNRKTKKFQQVLVNPAVTMFIDTRNNDPKDIKQAVSIAAHGIIIFNNTLEFNLRERLKTLYLEKHPYMNDFLASEETEILGIQVHHYQIVSEFENVQILLTNQ